ncbi:hypothetical protein [Brevundimonas sp. Root1279]|uniref:hypothetical protein n=1 Tax=Brevundimonas sp. Root1279 TaxID=1736443 RepID=UPI0006FA17A7|nr:hypothetical protein [Brevundimonas sp. Root1279]KQW78754.1 hypothetical protein ASC65_15680 [Brevundimonas sp. Root1279]
MKRIMPMATALALALSLPQAAAALDNNGNGNGHGRDHGDKGGKGHNDDRGGRGHQGRGNDRADRDHSRGPQAVRIDTRRDDHRGPDHRDERGRGHDRDVRVVEREINRVVVDRDRPVVYLRTAPDRGLIAGCPPGLAKKHNGCLPPGQARQLERSRYDYVWRVRDDRFDYRYDDGYLYRLSPQGSLLGYLPVLGGALSPGNVWPAQYVYEPAPRYYVDYFGLNDRYNYRYADGAIYGLDPQTQAIGQVAALLTGQQWNVGQRMPSGYDVYNVPYAYRSQYADTQDRLYRYNDGYVYQVDPTTQLVQAVIQLLT